MIFHKKIMTDNRFRKIETYIFFLVLILNLIPVLSVRFFPTLDGPVHLYNSNLINHLLTGDHSRLHDFFEFNPEPVPNWTGHFILSFFNLFLPAFLAEKMLLMLYLTGLPVFFRRMVKTIAPENYFMSYLIFPFTYSYLFFQGFYSFSLAIVFLLITLNYWIKHEDQMFSFKGILTLTLFMVLLYFSHIFVFELGLLLIGLNILVKGAYGLYNGSFSLKEMLTIFFKKCGILILSSIIPLILSCRYVLSRPFEADSYVGNAQLIAWLKNLRPYVTLDIVEKPAEEINTKILFYLIVSLFFIVIYGRLIKIKFFEKYPFRSFFSDRVKKPVSSNDFWLLAAGVMLLLYFILPDSFGSGSYISTRLELLFYILFIIWLSIQYLPKWVMLLLVMVILFCSFRLDSCYIVTAKKLDLVATSCNNASAYIEPNSIVLPLNYSDDWYYVHLSNYLGIDKPIVLLENYECGKDYFPLRWKTRLIPLSISENIKPWQSCCTNWKNILSDSTTKIDYIFVLGNMDATTDSCNNAIKQIIRKSYTQIYTTEYCRLYRGKKR